MRLVPISAEGLAPLATLLVVDPERRLAFPAVTEAADCAASLVLSTNRTKPASLPHEVTRVERHPHTTQTFLPLAASRWLVMVMPSLADGSPDLSGARAFLAGPGDAVCFHRNVWHAPLTVFDEAADMAMLMWRAEAGDDAVLFDLPEPLRIG